MWLVKTFEALSKQELYAILALRSRVFVVEQTCVYQDIDDLDNKATHILLKDGEKIIAYARVFAPNDYYQDFTSIGRVVVPKSYRGKGLAHELLVQAISYLSATYPKNNIQIGAQTYLKAFYETYGFSQTGEPYIEDGIPHIHMLAFIKNKNEYSPTKN